MSTKLQQGISILYDLELNDYLMAKAISKLDSEINSLGLKRNINKPTKKIADTEGFYWTGVITVSIAAIAAVIGAICGFIKTDGFFMKLLGAVGEAIAYAFYGGIAGLVIAIVVCSIRRTHAESDAEKDFKEDWKRYEKEIDMDKHRVSRELKQKEFLIQQRNTLVARRNEAAKKRNKYYNIIGIDPKYRNLVPIGYMNEFARLGISRKLEGADGLYYLVRNELRFDQMQCTLNDIAYKLDTIVDKQRELYAEVLQINKQCDRMVSLTVQSAKKTEKAIGQVVENTSIAAYNSERISQELAFQNFMLCY